MKKLDFIKKGLTLLTSKEKKEGVFVTLFSTIIGFIDLLIITSVIPLTLFILNENSNEPLLLKFKQVISNYLTLDKVNFDRIMILILISLILLGFFLQLIKIYWLENLCRKIQLRVNTTITNNCMNSSIEWLNERTNAILFRQITQDTSSFSKDFLRNLIGILESLILIIIPLSGSILIGTPIGFLIFFVTGIFVIIIHKTITIYILKLAIKDQQYSNQSSKFLWELLNASREIKLSGNTNFFIIQYKKIYNSMVSNKKYLLFLRNIPALSIKTLGQIIFLLLTIMLLVFEENKEMVIPQIAMFGLLIAKIAPSLSTISSKLAALNSFEPFLDSLLELNKSTLQMSRKFETNKKLEKIPIKWNVLKLDKVYLYYKNRSKPILNNINLKLEYGKKYCIIGLSGSGKTSLLNVLSGLVEPSSGKISLDKKNFLNYSMLDWNNQLAFVSQNTILINSTIKNNIFFNNQINTNTNYLKKIIFDSGLTRFINSIPNGLDNVVGDFGINLSGGQKQRISIARAFYRDPKMYFLDEIDNGLDNIISKSIFNKILKRSINKFLITVTHKLDCLEKFDQIIILKNGTIKDMGTLQELNTKYNDIEKAL